MRILFVTHRFPFPPRDGARVRAFHSLRHLARRHEVTVLAPVRSEEEAKAGIGLAEHCHSHRSEQLGRNRALAQMALCLPTRKPSSLGYFHSASLARWARAKLAAGAFDFAFVHCSSVAHYVLGQNSVPKVLDFVDMDSQKWLDYAPVKPWPLSTGYGLEGRKLQAWERHLAEHFDLCTVATRREAQSARDIGITTPVEVFPNGVDLEFFAPGSESYEEDHICFVGRMDYFPNEQCMVTFCAEVLPRIRQVRPAARLTIVGANPTATVRKLAELDGVTVTGTVDDVRPYVRRAAVAVAPLFIARGTQNKILEAMALGTPVVASDLAAAGVDAVPGEHLLAAGSSEGLAGAVTTLLSNPSERARLAEAGRLRVATCHSWESAMARLDGILADHIAGIRQQAA